MLGEDELIFLRNSTNVDELNELLLNHIFRQTYPLENAKDGDTVQSIAGHTIKVSVENDTIIKFNGVEVGWPRDIIANNGILHAIEGVLIPTPETSPPTESPTTLAPSKTPPSEAPSTSTPTENPSSTIDDTPASSVSSQERLSSGAIAGIVVASGVVFVALVAISIRQFQKANHSAEELGPYFPGPVPVVY